MGISIWEEQSFLAERDVIIAGAGLAGLWAAYELHKKDQSLNILLVEKGPIPAGASTRNAGFACFGSPTEMLHDCRLLGEDNMWHLAEMRYRGIEKIKAHFNNNLIELDPCGGFEVLKPGYEGLTELNENINWLNKGLHSITGLENTFVRHDEKLTRFNLSGFAGLVENTLEAGINSGKLVQALTRKVLGLGIDIFYGAGITHWEGGENNVTVATGNGLTLKAKKLLFCTNGFTGGLVKTSSVKPARGQILLTAPVKNLALRGTFHYDEGYYYFRDLGNRVLLGGARNKAVEAETTTELETTELVQNELERFLHTQILAGQNITVEKRWSGIMAFTESKLPEVRHIAPNVDTLIACNGMGVALTPIMAEKAAEFVLGQ